MSVPFLTMFILSMSNLMIPWLPGAVSLVETAALRVWPGVTLKPPPSDSVNLMAAVSRIGH